MSKWLGMVVVVLGASLVHANIISNGDFELGDATGWTVSNTDISATVEASAQSSFSSGTGGISFVDGTADSISPYIKKTFAGQSNGYYRVSMDFKIGAIVNAPWAFDLRTDGSADNAFVFQIRHDNFELRNATSGLELVADNLLVDTWYHVEIIIDSENDKWVSGSVTDGNTYAASWGEFTAYASSGQFNQMLIHDSAAAENSSLMLDNIVVEETDTPSAPSVISNGDFELGSAGWLLSASTEVGASATLDAAAQSDFSTGTTGVYLVDAAGLSTYPRAQITLAGVADGVYDFSFDFQYASAPAALWNFNLKAGGAVSVMNFQLNSSNFVLRDADNGNGFVKSGLTTGVWYQVTTRYDSVNDQVLSGSITPFGGEATTWGVVSTLATTNLIDTFIVSDGNSSVAGGLYVDNFKLVAVEAEPPVEDLEIGTIGIDSDGVNVFIDWLGDTNGTYTLQKKTILSEATWSNVVEDITGVDGAMIATNSLTSPAAFYRVIGQ